MSDEAVIENTNESTTQESTSENANQNDAQNRHETNGKPAGYHPVDPATASPEEVKQRIDYLYRQVKDQGRYINDYRSIAQQQSDKINELMNGMGQVVDHIQTKSVEENIQDARQKMQSAFESGDTKVYLAEQERLNDLKVNLKDQKKNGQQNQTRQQAHAGTQINQQQSSGNFDPVVDAWQNETDERGNPVRPWAKTDNTDDPDPDFLKALAVAKRVWTQNPNRSAKENLAEVDKIMGVKKSGGGQNVMGGSLNTPAKGGTIRLSPNQERIAVKTRFAGKDKSDAEHIAAYRKQIEIVQSKTKGGR